MERSKMWEEWEQGVESREVGGGIGGVRRVVVEKKREGGVLLRVSEWEQARQGRMRRLIGFENE